MPSKELTDWLRTLDSNPDCTVSSRQEQEQAPEPEQEEELEPGPEPEPEEELDQTGPAWPGGVSMVDRVVLPYLSGQGIEHLDRVIVSHSDVDHAGGSSSCHDCCRTGTRV